VVYGVEGVNQANRAAGIAGDEWARRNIVMTSPADCERYEQRRARAASMRRARVCGERGGGGGSGGGGGGGGPSMASKAAAAAAARRSCGRPQ
jgi:hypothetical protein